MRRSLLCLTATLLFVSCSGKPSAPTASSLKPQALSNLPDSAPPEPILNPENKGRTGRIKRSDLREQVSDWITRNPGATYKKTAQMANRIMQKVGFPLTLDASALLKKGQNSLTLQTSKKTFLFESGKELQENEEICGERYLQIPALIKDDKSALILSEGKKYSFSLTKFRREKFNIRLGNKIITTIYTPEPAEPIGIAPKGNALYLKFSLDEIQTEPWFLQATAEIPQLYGEEPYLVLRVEKNRLAFEENLQRLIPQEFEAEESGTESLRWRFKPSDFILELPSRCGQ